MRDVIAKLVEPVIDHALDLEERLRSGAAVDLVREQAALRDLLLTDIEASCYEDYGADERVPAFLGIRYALVCWLDDLFTLAPFAAAAWNDCLLEPALYGTRDRAWRFWEQARLAESRLEGDAQEVFFLCVMLGFRGELRHAPEQLETWVSTARARIQSSRILAWEEPPALDPVSNVPALRAQGRLHTLFAAGGVLLLAALPVAMFFLMRELGR